MKIKVLIQAVIERFALLLLKFAGSTVRVYPVHMQLYEAEIRELCAEEAKGCLSTDDLLGSHYFRARRVMSKMKKKYPALQVRDLWSAVEMIFDFEELR